MTPTETAIKGRYWYRILGSSTAQGPWMPLGTFTNTEAGHIGIIAEFNKRDARKYFWRWEQPLSGDIDA